MIGMMGDDHYKFSSTSQDRVNYLCNKLLLLSETDVNLMPWRVVFPIQNKEFLNIQKQKSTTRSLVNEVSKDLIKKSSVIVISSSSESKKSYELDNEEEVCKKKVKRSHLSGSSVNSKAENAVQVEELNEELLKSVDELKDFLQRSSEGAAIQTDDGILNLFNKLSPIQMESVCQRLRVSDLNENSLVALCQAAVVLEPELSFCNCIILSRNCFINKLLSLENTASRILMGTITSFAQKFAKQFIESIVVLCLKDIGAFQSELFCKLVKEVFVDEHRNILLKEILDNCENLSDPLMTLLQTTTDAMMNLEEQNLNHFSLKMAAVSERQAQNLKFTKYILSFINKYGNQLSADHVANLTEVLDVNKTFLKKAALAALKKFQPKF